MIMSFEDAVNEFILAMCAKGYIKKDKKNEVGLKVVDYESIIKINLDAIQQLTLISDKTLRALNDKLRNDELIIFILVIGTNPEKDAYFHIIDRDLQLHIYRSSNINNILKILGLSFYMKQDFLIKKT